MRKQVIAATLALLISAGNVSAQEIEKNDTPKYTVFSAAVFKDKYKSTNLLIDVREPSLFAKWHLKGAINLIIANASLPGVLKNRKREDNVYVYAEAITAAAQAADLLTNAGFLNVYILEGKYSELVKLGMLEVK
ncbi:MAG TPA: rhodanese-like domain-containing protein [Bacteroidia bacterium]|nr:rhodanese-like domain-containing protein [Bacteroidia bacterium]HRH09567.1 rhodanese-like domain-containing protein [Bacteroidia bacterium]